MATLTTLKRPFLTRLRSLRVANYYVKPKKKRGPSGQAWAALAGVTTAIVGTGVYLLGKPEEEIAGMGPEEPAEYANKNIVMAYLLRAWDKVLGFRKGFSDPSSDKLLPDFLPPPYQRPYTLILEMNDVLLHTSYDRRNGWKYQKRPGVDALLLKLVDFYEIVVFTSESSMSGHNLLTALDPNGLILYKLFRDSTNYMDGIHVKDLTHLNRPLSRVIIVDTDRKSVKLQPENSIILEKWTGDIEDKTLWDLIPFLQTIAVNDVDDVRPVLDFYKSQRGEEKILETFQLNKAQVKAEEERRRAEMEQLSRQGVQRGVGGAISTFSLGRRQQSMQQVTPPPNVEAMPLDPQASEVPGSETQSWTEWIGSWIGWK